MMGIRSCITYHKIIIKKRITCQAVSNNLDAEVVPKQLQDLRKFDKILV